MLARESKVSLGGLQFSTPLLLPSFSSKGFSEIKQILRLMSEFITGGILISAYDLVYASLTTLHLTFPSFIFVDSGGYEARVEQDLSDAYGYDYRPKQWTKEDHTRILRDWPCPVPSVVVSFDSPRRHTSLPQQIKGARRLQESLGDTPVELLIKPEKRGDMIDSMVVLKVAKDLQPFPIIGFTERELGTSLMGRMVNLARIRRGLDEASVPSPIHVFGSLDTLTTPLYYMAGAEVFDGLTWLRFGYHEGATMYSHNYAAIRGATGMLRGDLDLAHNMWIENYYYLEGLRDQMVNFARRGDCSAFSHVGTFVQDAGRQLEARLAKSEK